MVRNAPMPSNVSNPSPIGSIITWQPAHARVRRVLREPLPGRRGGGRRRRRGVHVRGRRRDVAAHHVEAHQLAAMDGRGLVAVRPAGQEGRLGEDAGALAGVERDRHADGEARRLRHAVDAEQAALRERDVRGEQRLEQAVALAHDVVREHRQLLHHRVAELGVVPGVHRRILRAFGQLGDVEPLAMEERDRPGGLVAGEHALHLARQDGIGGERPDPPRARTACRPASSSRGNTTAARPARTA